MEIWRVGYGDKRPEVLNARNLTVALCLHVGFFVLFFLYSAFHDLFHNEEEIIPIDLTVIVNENLNGKPDEPPPLKNPEPEKPKPKPQPKPKEPEKPKELEQIVTNVVAKVEKKEEKPEKPKEPKKTKEQLRQERIEKMRASAKVVNKRVEIEVKGAKASGDGRTDRKTLSNAEIMKLLTMGYEPGTSEQLATSELQLGYSLIKSALEAKWDKPPWTDTLRPMTIRVFFGNGGRLVNFRLEKSSGDARADQSIKSAASRVGSIPALPPAFIDKFRARGVPVEFTVKPE